MLNFLNHFPNTFQLRCAQNRNLGGASSLPSVRKNPSKISPQNRPLEDTKRTKKPAVYVEGISLELWGVSLGKFFVGFFFRGPVGKIHGTIESFKC